MAVSVAPAEIIGMRLRALLLTSNPVSSPAAVVGHLFAAQGQDFAAVRWALACRAGTPDSPAAPETVAQAFNSGEVVRSWPMRGTVHIMQAADLGWMQELTNPGVLKTWPKRREYLELDLRVYEQAREISRDALAGNRSIGRSQLVELWQESGIEMGKGWSYHLVWALCQHGETVFGPMNDAGELELVLTDEWVKDPKQYEPDAAFAEFCLRYFTGHGPATVQDLMWWSQLPARSLKAGIKAAGDQLVELESGGKTYYALPEQLADRATDRSQLVLTPFDEHLLGYKDRSLMVDPANAKQVMTVNGIAQPTVVVGGRVVATWKLRDGELSQLAGETLTKRGTTQAQGQIAQVRHWLGRS